MGKFIDKFKGAAQKVEEGANKTYKSSDKQRNVGSKLRSRPRESISSDIYEGADEFYEGLEDYDDDYDKYGVGIQPAQKSESFHHFILQNQYQDLEKSIRGYKDVYNKEQTEPS